ncbi:MAG: PCMD domain-containing protein [Bacteroidales bacterium]|nr:PCMD domain-containing protein [Bacteroidales bacterium]MDD4671120.1 PCMD domain-containing protein [Bacteroidales bacterium]
MNRISIILLSVIILFTASCEKGRPLNMEADILSLDFREDIIIQPIIPSGELIELNVNSDVDLSSLTPVFSISEGAVITPASDIPQDFQQPVTYTVTSEDGNWQQIYTISVSNTNIWRFDFEQWDTFYRSYMHPSGWASGNPGIFTMNALLSQADKLAYPTYCSEDTPFGKYCVEMQTRKGGQSSLIPALIAGSLFTGVFKTEYAMIDPLKCPQFGIKYNYTGTTKPYKLTGWLKYTSGPKYYDADGNPVGTERDRCSFFAVLFSGEDRITSKEIQSGERVIAKAEMTPEMLAASQIENNGFIYLEIPFIYTESIPSGTYLQLAIIASSSKDGDYYRGAPESKLSIDNVEIIFE